MNYVEVNNLSKSYSEKQLFRNISFKIEQGDKVSLIAKNGSGKTTLINIILGNELPDEGTIDLRNDIHINYLNQDNTLNQDATVLDTIFESDNQFIKCIKNYNKCLIDATSHDKSDIEKLDQAISMMDSFDAWNYETKVQEILQVFDIPNLNAIVGHLSGGQQKRLALAKVLIDKSDMLFLDEPTNHLDIEMIEWLEKYLIREKITFFLISHDRYFIDNVCDTILELDNTSLYRYRGNYSNFLIKKAEREELEIKNIENARSKYRIELEWMRRQPQARQHKSKKREENFYVIEKVAKQQIKYESFNFNVQSARLGKKIMELYDISKSYGDKCLIKNFSYTFVKGDRIGIVGKNGVGKSTFLNIITQKLQPDSGKVVVGSTIRFGYFGQKGLEFNDDKTILEIVKEYTEMVNVDSREIGASQFLTYFNFPPAVQHNKFGRLSGGEKRRFYLLLLLMQSPNFLILDEPTNDLDIQTLTLLETFLETYEGVLIVVSHDRLFLDKLSEHTFAFEGNGVIKDYPGNYTDYVEWKKRVRKAAPSKAKEETSTNKKVKTVDNEKRKATFKEKKEYEEISDLLVKLDEDKTSIINKLNDATTPVSEMQELSIRFAEVEKKLSELEDRWLELSEIIDNQ